MAEKIHKKKGKKQQEILLSEGIILSGLDARRKGNFANLLVRAVFLFAIVTGSLGGMLSAFQISYAKWAFFLSAFLAALYCASLYASVWWENIGYVLIFIFALYAGFGLSTYISSGFYGILNDIAASASVFFGSDAQINYVEQVEDHSLAISIAMCYFALIGCIVTNGLISRRANYLAACIPAIFFLLVPVYLEQEPAGGYVILLTAGVITVYIHRHNQYPCQHPKPKALLKSAKKHLLLGNFSSNAALGTLLAVVLLCTAAVGITELFIPREAFMSEKKRSALKLQTMDSMENLYLLGAMGIINFYPTTGGLVNGRLGGVSSVRLDYETDLTLEFMPYTYDRIYLKTFIGAEYMPYENRWNTEDENVYAESWEPDTARRLENAFLSGEDGYAQGVMKIRNVAAMTGVYLPYYSKDTRKILRPGTEQEYTFYPLLTKPPKGSSKAPVTKLWLEIPEENIQAVANFCTEAGLSGSTQEIIAELRDYFQQEFPYTLSPGATPRKKDFVNYFLSEKRKGYCAHYASSAVLILRYMGIPARYVEGYAVDAMDIAEDAELTAWDVPDYYKGTSLLPQSSVVSYDATDGNAHAWVEIYDETLGWYPIELTPYRTDEENDRNGLWEMFTRLFQTGQDADADDDAAQGTLTGTDIANALRTSAYRLLLCLGLLLLAVLSGFFMKKGMRRYRYNHAGRNEKLLMQYRDVVQKASAKNIPSDKITDKKNFEEQVLWLSEKGILTADNSSLERLARTLNEAAFSPREISAVAFEAACKTLLN